MEGLVYSGKFALQNRLGQFIFGRQTNKQLCVTLHFCFVLFCI